MRIAFLIRLLSAMRVMHTLLAAASLFRAASSTSSGQMQRVVKRPTITSTSLYFAVPTNLPSNVIPSSLSKDNPGNYSSDQINPLILSTLITAKDCPGVNTTGTGVSCQYPSTPTTGQITWTCPAGYYCLGPSKDGKFPCTPGFYCPENAAQPIYCPKGIKCSNDTKTAELCPGNHYCPIGTVEPYKCFYLVSCPPGSDRANKIGVILIFVILSLFICFLFYIKSIADLERKLKHKREQEDVAQNHDIETKLERLEKTFEIQFENLGITLPGGTCVMKGVTGALHSGRTCAIMGPSGAGKTTFVSLLTGKAKRTSGSVIVNGVAEELSKYKKLIGFVPQEDVMLRELTVRDILMHSARMRLPANWEFRRIKRKVIEIISFLGLSAVVDNPIGDEMTRGISGGQRKRVNIAMELVALPSLLILDEPTSGLDSSTSFEVCENLKKIARMQGLTVAAIIHSPSPATFRQFDDLILLGKGGRLVYTGPREECVKYFKSIGFTCPAEQSPSDFFMDVATGKVPSEFEPSFRPSDLFEYWVKTRNGIDPFAGHVRMTPEQAKESRDKYLSGDLGEVRLMSSLGAPTPLVTTPKLKRPYAWLEHILVGFVLAIREWLLWLYDVNSELEHFIWGILNGIRGKKDPVRHTCSYYMQIWLLMRRSALQVYKTSYSIVSDLALHFLSGVFISIAVQQFGFLGVTPGDICLLAPLNLQYQCTNPLDTLREAGMYIALGSFFAGISVGMNTFGREKVVYWRDISAGMNTIPYFFAKFVTDLPRILFGSFMFFCAILIMFPYKQPMEQLYSIIILYYFNAFAMGYWISIALPINNGGLLSTGFSLFWALAISGIMPSLDDVEDYPPFIKAIWSLSAPRWGVEIFWLNELSSLWWVEKYKDPINTYKWGEQKLAYINMIGIAIAWNVLTLLSLKLLNRSKQK